MPSLTARQICTTALRLIGVASSEEPITADMAQAALDALNALIDSSATERLLIPTRPKLALPLVAGQQSYTWGLVAGETTPADLSAPAPLTLEICLLHIGGTPPQEWPLEVVDQATYEAGILLKTFTSSYPELVYLEPTQPYARLWVWPVPDTAYTLQLVPWPALPWYAHLDSAVDWPEGSLRYWQYALAVDLAPQYGVEASPTVQRVAEDAKRAIYPLNATVGRLELLAGRRGGSGLTYPRGFLTGRS